MIIMNVNKVKPKENVFYQRYLKFFQKIQPI